MRRLLQTHRRPIVWVSCYLISGILGGYIGQTQSYITSLFFYGMLVISILAVSFLLESRFWLLLVLPLGLGSVIYGTHPVVRELAYVDNQIHCVGKVVEISTGAYGATYTLSDVKLIKDHGLLPLRSKMQVQTQEQKWQLGDKIQVNGVRRTILPPMNPSDMDYKLYLQSKGILAIIQEQKSQVIESKPTLLMKIKKQLIKQIDEVFAEQSSMIGTILLREGDIDEELKAVYNRLGIGHLLVVSGLHVGIIFAGVWWLLGKIGINYTVRCMLSIVCIGLYVALIGGGISASRGALLLATLLIAKIVWEEPDEWIIVSLVVSVMLLVNPYQLFQVGFQLSFMAVMGIIASNKIYKRLQQDTRLSKRQLNVLNGINYMVTINLWIQPILAWHFFQIPVLGIVLNVILIPLISSLIPLMFVTLALSSISLPLASLIGGSIAELLTWCNNFVISFEALPYSWVVVGRPSVLAVIGYYMVLSIGLYSFVTKRLTKKISVYTLMICISVYLIWPVSDDLLVTHLYVGQGDACVIITPSKQVIVIDTGDKGSEKTLWRYLNYKGYSSIDYLIVSHPHQDHFGGAIKLVEQHKPIGHVFVSDVFEHEASGGRWLSTLKEQVIPYTVVRGGEQLTLGEVSLTFLPSLLETGSANNLSKIILLTYGEYAQLFTGDIERERETKGIGLKGEITVLKVAHHGSNTSTSPEFLEQIQPKYGMISCGINNRYNHPSQEVVKRLNAKGVQVNKTPKSGAIKYITNGKNIKVVTQLQEEMYENTGD